jgi:acyl carrier protein
VTADTEALHAELIEWVRSWHEDESTAEVDLDTPLLANGLLDSMGMVAFVSHLEERTDKSFDFSTYMPGPTASIRTLLDHCLGR